MKNKNNYWIVAVVLIAAAIIIWPLMRGDSTPSEDTTGELSGDELDLIAGLGGLGDGNDETATPDLGLVGDVSVMGKDDLPTAPPAVANAGLMTVEAYFARESDGADAESCSLVYPIPRLVPQTPAVARAALAELLAGPTPAEAELGYVSALAPDVTLNNLTLQEGVAKATFNDALNAGVESECRAGAIRAQIERTLKQFPTINEVIISPKV